MKIFLLTDENDGIVSKILIFNEKIIKSDIRDFIIDYKMNLEEDEDYTEEGVLNYIKLQGYEFITINNLQNANNLYY